MSGWRDTALGELIRVKHGFAFLGEYFAKAGTHVVLTPGNFEERGGFRSRAEKEKWYTGPIPPEYVLRRGDVVVAMTEQAEGLLGSSAIVPRDDLYLHNQRLGLVQIRQGANLDFVYHLFNSPSVRHQIRATASGAKVRHTAPSRIEAVKVRVPDVREQRRIAGILSAYDDLIENCERRIRVLDEMARALYREWFVLFRYPGHEKTPLVDSPLGRIPKGWQVATAGAVLREIRRGVPKGALADGVVRYVGLEHIPRRSLALDAWQETSDLGSNKLRFEREEVLFGKIRPYFHKVSIAPFAGVCSADTFVISPTHATLHAFAACLASSDEFVAHATATSNGAKMPRANWDVMMDFPLTMPPQSTLTTFSALVEPWLADQQGLVAQAHNLRKTRDLLLPRLLSGQLSVEDAA